MEQWRRARGIEWAVVATAQATALAGVLAVLLGWRPGAWVVAGAITALIGFHVSLGAWAYRRVMRREWPKVEPLADDDDW